MPSLPRPGDRLAGHRIERELGHGTTGTVYLAHQEALGRNVALKVVGRPLADDPAFRERFRREARAVAGLDHPNVVQILETGEDDAHLWLAMRLVGGPDLRVLLRRTGRLEPEQAVTIVEQVAAALDAAHAAGLVHRDVKPGNVLIEDGPGRDLHVELADFGLARAPGVDDAEGTPGYAAPEQLAGDEAGPAADVFGLGCVLYELLTGVAPPAPSVVPQGVPWRRGPDAAPGTGDDDGAAAPAPAKVHGAALPLTPSEAWPRLGGAFDPAVQRATAADPADRFASAGQLALWARAALTVPAAPPVPDPTDPVRIAAATPAVGAEIAPAAPTWEIAPPTAGPRRRRGLGRKLLVASFLALVLALLGVAFVLIGDLGDSSTDRRAGTSPTPPGGATARGGATGGPGSGSTAPGAGGTSGGGATGGSGMGGTSGGGATGGSGGAGGPAGSGGSSGRTGSAAGAAGPGTSGSNAPGSSAPSAGPGRAGTSGSSTGASGTGGAGDLGRGSGGSGRRSSSGSAAGRSSRSRSSSGDRADSSVPRAARTAPRGSSTAPLPPIPAGATRFGGGAWILDLPTAEGWRQTATQELDDGARIVTRLERADRVRIVVEALPGRTAVAGIPGARSFPVRLPDAGRTDGALYRGGRYAMCSGGGVCAAFPANGPSGGVLVITGAHRAAGAKRIARRSAMGLRVR